MGDRYEIDSKSVNLRNFEFNLHQFYSQIRPVMAIFGQFSQQVDFCANWQAPTVQPV